ncbi:MAG: class I SAM-dependent methyltransferase [Sphingomonadaceae bacterium]|nr:class I SAM-dependent methyltransferase [Sphingomonadaceae bacterium]
MQSAVLASRPDDEARRFVDLLERLRTLGYRFVTPTPATHARWLARSGDRTATTIEEVLGWNLPFAPGAIDAGVEQALRAADALDALPGGLVRARLRVARLDGELYLHSQFPTEEKDAIFFGPDSYRFARLIADTLTGRPLHEGARAVDIGTGAGVGAITIARHSGRLDLIGTDVNPAALRLARCNVAAAGVEAALVRCEALDGVEGDLDLVVANPPYIMDDGRRTYRDGGDLRGGALSIHFAAAALARLRRGGRMILYTGSAIAGGDDAVRHGLETLAAVQGAALRYREIDPDVFGEELERPCYAGVDRIAAVAAVLTRL